ncbi:FitA-like ribbon-helix-helix domain-containing protein [Cupriavidus lacunae]|uniref:Plasmid stabilization protein n=1 Tax=Cupriavidus lacunae TaxID=2666307 RepID=A0A370NUE0_9BURK|nr:Arc family DNA-binding protein [Cupriavidus lacunae]RDK09226.1 plasmid stabilization protein [Cupriavidus lacunae]
MPILTVRNVPDDVHRALCARALQNGRTVEAELIEILADAVLSAGRLQLGDALAALGRELGLSNADIEAIEHANVRCQGNRLHLD